MSNPGSSRLALLVMALFVMCLSIFLFDILFSKPEHQQGVVVEKLFIPAHTEVSSTPYGGVKRGNYFIAATKQDQWIALVKMQNGEILKVHCLPDHYHTRNVGDAIHFRKYEGKLLHIEYFAHNEEED